jgi:hypothetical protein
MSEANTFALRKVNNVQKVSDSERSEPALFAQGEVSYFSCCRGTECKKTRCIAATGFFY